jgi:hypothetical protein
MRLILITALMLSLGSAVALAQRMSPPSGNAPPALQPPTDKSPASDAIADCMRLWEPATHMSKPEWARTCRRVQNRIESTQVR